MQIVLLFEQMGSDGSWKILMKLILWMIICLMLQFKQGFGIRFEIDKEECLSQNIEYEGDIVRVSFVVIKVEPSWHYGDERVDLVIKGPTGEQIHGFHEKTSSIYEFMAQQRGVYRFCFKNVYDLHETIDFDVHVAHHMSYYDQHAKDEHFNPMLEEISKLEEALINIQFEQHWLEAQTDRQAIVNEIMSQRVVHKVVFESMTLVGASFLQLFLLQRLFEQKIGKSRV